MLMWFSYQWPTGCQDWWATCDCYNTGPLAQQETATVIGLSLFLQSTRWEKSQQGLNIISSNPEDRLATHPRLCVVILRYLSS